MNPRLAVPGRDEDVPVRMARWEVLPEIGARIVCVVEEDKPWLVRASEPVERVVHRLTDFFRARDVLETCDDGRFVASVDDVDS